MSKEINYHVEDKQKTVEERFQQASNEYHEVFAEHRKVSEQLEIRRKKLEQMVGEMRKRIEKIERDLERASIGEKQGEKHAERED